MRKGWTLKKLISLNSNISCPYILMLWMKNKGILNAVINVAKHAGNLQVGFVAVALAFLETAL
jgi:hypothetical protein